MRLTYVTLREVTRCMPLYGVHRTCAETAAVSCGTSHDSAVSTPLLRWIFKNALLIKLHSCRITYERSESARERRIALYKSDQQQQRPGIVQELCESRGGRPGLVRPNEPSGFRGRKDLLNRASALVTTCP